jgi:hypothetical protein
MSRVLLHLLLLGSFSIARGQELPADSPDQDAKALTAEFRKQAKHMMMQYEFNLPERPDVKFELIPEPVLYWTNPIAGQVLQPTVSGPALAVLFGLTVLPTIVRWRYATRRAIVRRTTRHSTE